MRAFVVREYGAENRGYSIEELPDPVPEAGQVLVELNAANVTFVDRLIAHGDYQVRPPLPFIPGAVGAGVIAAQGPGVSHLPPGTRVAVLKSTYGNWSTHIAVDAWAVIPLPDGVSDIAAAAAIEAYGTASYALEERLGLHAGETALILGAEGAVGAAAVDIALHLDATVIAYTSDPTQWDDRAVKPDIIIDRREGNLRAQMKAALPQGADVVMDPVGGDNSEQALRSLAAWGRYAVVGFASGTIPRLPANFILLSNRSVVGVEWATWITTHHDSLAGTLGVVLTRLARGALHMPEPVIVKLSDLPGNLGGPPPPTGLVRTIVVPD